MAVPADERGQRAKLAESRVAIIGCGGLGSNVASMLLRAGVRELTLIDFDVVEEDNLNRQLFFREQIGMPKVEALASTLRRIDPDVRLTLVNERVTEDTLVDIVSGSDVVVEAVDTAEGKAMICQACTCGLPDVPLVTASGLAGVDSANLIVTEPLAENVWVVGDLSADSRAGHGLFASRVMVAAAHEAHAAIRLILGFDEP